MVVEAFSASTSKDVDLEGNTRRHPYKTIPIHEGISYRYDVPMPVIIQGRIYITRRFTILCCWRYGLQFSLLLIFVNL